VPPAQRGAAATGYGEAVIEGFEIGHHTADREGWLTGTTVVLARAGAVGGVDVRGGAPGTRETDLLSPTSLVDLVHAIVLTGGSAYGLAAAHGVMSSLEQAGVGFPVGKEPEELVPIVPAAVIFDLGRGGVFGNRPTAEFGASALAAASTERPASGCVGGGTGAVCGGMKGGFGYAEMWLDAGDSVAAAVVVNASGAAFDPRTGLLWADRLGQHPSPDDAGRAALTAAHATPQRRLNTTIGVVLTDATLTSVQANKLAAVAHDGLARAVRPVHSMTDGDTIFGLASGRRPQNSDPVAALGEFNLLLAAGADVFTDACLDALLAATGRGEWRSYRELTAAQSR
jgi:L-aminopeptidase/D-esterase-like protein